MSCLGENRPDWFAKIQNLILSLRHFGGSLSGAPVVVNLVGGARPDFVSSLAELDAPVRVVEPFDHRLPTSNKLRMLELASMQEFDVLLMLDCDVIVRGDLAGELDTKVLRAVPAGKRHLTEAAWDRLYADLELPRPTKRFTMVSGEVGYPYFNTGVLAVPGEICSTLLQHWGGLVTRLLDNGLSPLKDQIPFACALASAGLDIDPLPFNLNLSTTRGRVAGGPGRRWGPPFVLHYHKSIDKAGFLLPSPNREISAYLDEFNLRRSEVLRVPYPGMTKLSAARRLRLSLNAYPWFWEAREPYRRARRLARTVMKRRSRRQ